MRSKLFVPGTRPEFFDKALAGSADALSFDLEDAVSEARKGEARDALRSLLGRLPAPRTDVNRPAAAKVLIVRVNPIGGPHFMADIDSVVQPGLHIINLPKPEHPDEVRAAADAIARAERANGTKKPIGLLLNIESPRALRSAAKLALADPRVVGLQLGLGDLFEPLGIDRRDVAAVQQMMLTVRIAAGEAGVYAYDSAFADIADTAGFRAEAALARRMGFLGKTCIHPSQVTTANEVFQPTASEIAAALKIVDAAARADADGVGAYVVDGKMIDGPFVIRARSIVAQARALGLLPPGR